MNSCCLTFFLNILKSFNIINCWFSISHADYTCKTTFCCCCCSSNNILFISKSWISEMYMCIHKSWCNNKSLCINYFCTFHNIKIISSFLNYIILNNDIHNLICFTDRIYNSSTFDYNHRCIFRIIIIIILYLRTF